MADLLARMAGLSARRAAEARAREPEPALLRRAHDAPPAPPLHLHPDGFDLIAEFKRRAPSPGATGPVAPADPAEAADRARLYSRAGAALISVLTEPAAFGGSDADLRAAARAAPVPTLRKDFLVDPYQIAEARASGAGGALLVLRLLDRPRLLEMIDAAASLGLFLLLEAFDETDLERAEEAAGAASARGVSVLAGVNARDLATLEVDGTRLRRLADRLPSGVPRVAESGLLSADDVGAAADLGYHAALVGRALMASADPETLVRSMIAAGRGRARSRCASA